MIDSSPITAGAGKGFRSDMIILASFCPINDKGFVDFDLLAAVTLVMIDIMRGATMISAAVDLVDNILLFPFLA
jgi:hypothetical protein